MRCEARTLEDIRALGGNDAADERCFATAARVSETNLALYRTFAQPVVQAMVSAPMADWMRKMHPLRLQYELFSDANPLMGSVAVLADQVRGNRKTVANENPFVAMQENISNQIVTALDAGARRPKRPPSRHSLRSMARRRFRRQSALILAANRGLRMATKSPLHRELLEKKIAELKSRIPVGGVREAVIRGLTLRGDGASCSG